MKKSLVVLLVVAFFVIILISSSFSAYNNMVQKGEGVSSQWAQVENVYQRRMDLIPNLVNTVKGYATHERETLEAVINARAKATQVTVDPSKLDAAAIKNFQETQGGLSSALGRLMVVMEQYPNLKANENFIALQAQLEGTENRIAVERGRFNEVARAYNIYIQQAPRSIIAKLFNFEKKAYFEAEQEAKKAPVVNFDK
jgi:LemA protein